MLVELKQDGYSYFYDDNEETKQFVFDEVMKYYKEHEAFCADTIMQCDNPQIEAPHVLANIAEKIFTYKED
jgi:hypothetical protein